MVDVDHLQLKNNIENGIKYLNTKFPGWADKIDTVSLNMNHSCHCILGQLIGSYWDTPEIRGKKTWEQNCRWGREYGFVCGLENEENMSESYEVLNKLWIEEINKRKEQK